MASTRPLSSHEPAAPPGAINLSELYHSTTYTRQALTTYRNDAHQHARNGLPSYDFSMLLTLLCEIYQSYAGELITMQPFHKNSERIEDGGHTSIVSRREIATPTPSNVKRGHTENLEESIIVKRTRQGVLESQSSAAMRSFIAELRVRTHPPLRLHPNIVDLKGVAWDFEDEELERPRPLLLEEFATERSLEHFWEARNLTRMPFKAKTDLCSDIAKGLLALHDCDIVHGDVKPGNILIFPHPVFAYENLNSLPAFTPQYCAPETYPEANGNTNLTFHDMKQTDVYSYGLVILSIVIGRSFYPEFGDGLQAQKKDDSMLARAIALVEKEDRENTDSDFDLVVLHVLFSCTIRLDKSRRNLVRCINTILRHNRMQQPLSIAYRLKEEEYIAEKIQPLSSTLLIGYQSLSQCSFLLKKKIVEELHKLVSDGADPRKPAACWELSICYFAGFGVEQHFPSASRWLSEAAKQGVIGAQAFFLRMHEAMEMNPYQALNGNLSGNSDANSSEAVDDLPARELVSEWLFSSAASGCSEILTDLQSQDPQRYIRARENHLTKLETQDTIDEHDLSFADEFSDEGVQALAHPLDGCDITSAAASGDLSLLQTLISRTPEAINFQDTRGNTAIIQAARCGRYDTLVFLLAQPQSDAGICNRGQQSALHLLSNFSGDEIRSLVPALVQKKASLTGEALPIRPSGEGLHLTPRIRSCPILQAILHNNVTLLQSLLTAAHLTAESGICRICEAGSRYRRILAIAISLHRAEAIETLIKHLEIQNAGRGTDLKKIEVWYNQALLPVWSLAIKAPAVGASELPESFFRALNYGKSYIGTLKKTLGLIWKPDVNFVRYGYELLQEAVLAANLDAIDFVMEEATRRGYSPSRWWMISDNFHENPLLLAVQLGFRDVFKRLSSLDQNLLNTFLSQKCCIKECRECREPFSYSWVGDMFAFLFRMNGKKHKINLAHIILSSGAVAAHQDVYFVSFVVEHTKLSHVLRPPTEFDARFAHQPTSYLAQAILANSFRAADIMLQEYSQALDSQVVYIVPSYLRTGSSRRDNLSVESYVIKFDTEPIPKFLPLVEYILLVGSYQSCRYLFRSLQDKRKAPALPRFGLRIPQRSATLATEAGDPRWGGLKLSQREYRAMLTGLIKDDREDRYPLWEDVSYQASQGHSKDWYYLRLALFYANNRALKELLRRGWSVNGPGWAFLIPPLVLARRLLTSQHHVLPSLDVAYKRQYGPGSEVKSPGYYTFTAFFNTCHTNRPSSLKKNVDTLEEFGAHVPVLFETAYFWNWIWTVYIMIYVLVLPLTIGFSVNDSYLTTGQTIGWMYYYAFLAMLIPPLPLILSTSALWNRPSSKVFGWIGPYFLIPMLWLFNHIALPLILLQLSADVLGEIWEVIFLEIIILMISIWLIDR